MASLATAISERRHGRRWPGGGSRFAADAVLRPGQAVRLINLSCQGALIDSGAPLRPGARTELMLLGPDLRVRVPGHVARCQIVRLDPVRYQGAIVFEASVEIGQSNRGSE